MKRQLIILLIFLSALFLGSCSNKLTPEQKIWNGTWEGTWTINEASGSWAKNAEIRADCTIAIFLDENSSGELQVDIHGYGNLYALNISSASVDKLEINGTCNPTGDGLYTNTISDWTVQAEDGNKKELHISGKYIDPIDGEGNAFSFSFDLKKKGKAR